MPPKLSLCFRHVYSLNNLLIGASCFPQGLFSASVGEAVSWSGKEHGLASHSGVWLPAFLLASEDLSMSLLTLIEAQFLSVQNR